MRGRTPRDRGTATTAERLTIEGEANLARYRHSDRLERRFCRLCGTQTLTTHAAEAGAVFVPLGILDGDALPRHEAWPGAHP